jgi:hypothetical protein
MLKCFRQTRMSKYVISGRRLRRREQLFFTLSSTFQNMSIHVELCRKMSILCRKVFKNFEVHVEKCRFFVARFLKERFYTCCPSLK